jgi:hypothetical protein
MTDSTHLERRNRRLLALYPKAFHREHEQEMLSVLMVGAAEGQRRPRLAESADLVRSAVFMRLRQTRLPSSWEYRHARFIVPVRIVVGIWLWSLPPFCTATAAGGEYCWYPQQPAFLLRLPPEALRPRLARSTPIRGSLGRLRQTPTSECHCALNAGAGRAPVA